MQVVAGCLPVLPFFCDVMHAAAALSGGTAPVSAHCLSHLALHAVAFQHRSFRLPDRLVAKEQLLACALRGLSVSPLLRRGTATRLAVAGGCCPFSAAECFGGW